MYVCIKYIVSSFAWEAWKVTQEQEVGQKREYWDAVDKLQKKKINKSRTEAWEHTHTRTWLFEDIFLRTREEAAEQYY